MESQKPPYSEKRSEIRLPINAKIDITLKEDNFKLQGVCCNMSASGILVRTKEKIKPGTELLLQMSEGKLDFSADGEVIRLVEDEKHFLVAIKLSNINS